MSTLLGSEGQGQSKGGEGTPNPGTGNPGNSGSGGQPSWRESLPEDIRSNPSLQTFTDVGALAKSYLHAQSMVGKKGVIVPGEKASDEEWQAFYKSIGQPESDKFEVKGPEGKQLNSDFVGKFKEIAHKSGLLPKQAQGLLDWYISQEEQAVKTRTEGQKTQVAQQIDGLKKEWGDGWDKNVSKARYAAKELGIQEYLDKSELGNDVQIIKALSKVGELYGEDKIRGEGGGRFGQTPDEFQKQIDDVMGNPNHPYFDRSHAGHNHAVAQMEQWFKGIYGDKK